MSYHLALDEKSDPVVVWCVSRQIAGSYAPSWRANL